MFNLADLSFKQFRNLIFVSAIIFIVAVSIILTVIFYGNLSLIKSIVKGYLIGGIASLINFRLMADKLEKFGAFVQSGAAESGQNAGVIIKNFFSRYFIIALILVIAALNRNTINIFAAIAGLFSVQVTIFLLFFLDKKKK